eukprot:SM000219S06695  [mRNA]  locus=s219:118646:119432:+ [translate_table: standard]
MAPVAAPWSVAGGRWQLKTDCQAPATVSALRPGAGRADEALNRVEKSPPPVAKTAWQVAKGAATLVTDPRVKSAAKSTLDVGVAAVKVTAPVAREAMRVAIPAVAAVLRFSLLAASQMLAHANHEKSVGIKEGFQEVERRSTLQGVSVKRKEVDGAANGHASPEQPIVSNTEALQDEVAR